MTLRCKKCGHVGKADVRPDPKHPNFPDLHCAGCGVYVFSVQTLT
jgi:hypothetical protein